MNKILIAGLLATILTVTGCSNNEDETPPLTNSVGTAIDAKIEPNKTSITTYDANETVLNFERAIFNLDYNESKKYLTSESLAIGTKMIFEKSDYALGSKYLETFRSKVNFINEYKRDNPDFLDSMTMKSGTIDLYTGQNAVEAIEFVINSIPESGKIQNNIIESIYIEKIEKLTDSYWIITTNNLLKKKDRVSIIKIKGTWKVILGTEAQRALQTYTANK